MPRSVPSSRLHRENGHLHAIEGKQALFGAAWDASAEVRVNAAISLGRLGATPDVIHALEVLLLDESSEAREWTELGLDIARGAG